MQVTFSEHWHCALYSKNCLTCSSFKSYCRLQLHLLCFSGELKRKDELLASMDKKQDEAREKMSEVQMQMQKLQAAPN